MLLRNDHNGVLAIGQTSHAWISGQLARAWGNAAFPAPTPSEEVCLAADQHDVGWAMWDLEPGRDPETGMPYSFMELPLEEHLKIWSGAPQRLLSQSRYAALLVSMHGSRLYRRRDLDELSETQVAAVRRYLEAELRFQQELLSTFSRLDSDQLDANSQLIWTWDFLSLAICLDWAPRTARDVPAADGRTDMQVTSVDERRIRLDPWPFSADSLTVRCEGRRLRRAYETDDGLGAALSDAPWESLEFELTSA